MEYKFYRPYAPEGKALQAIVMRVYGATEAAQRDMAVHILRLARRKLKDARDAT
jgi:hypothetical protein